MMLTLTALTLIAKGAIAYYTAHKSNDASPENTESEEDFECNRQMDESHPELSQIVDIKSNDRNPRCDLLYDQIAKILKDPSEDEVYCLEALFMQLRSFYPYEYILEVYNSLDGKSAEDIEDFAVNIIMADFDDFLSKHQQWENYKDNVHALMKDLSPLIKKSLRGNSYLDLLASYFKDKGKNEYYVNDFLLKIWLCYEDLFLDTNNTKEVKYNGKIYKKHETPPQIKNYKSLLGMAGRTYSKLISLYKAEGIFEEQGCLSNELVYDIAGSIMQYTEFYFCRGISTSRLAKDIMDSMIDYLHNDLMVRDAGMSESDYVDALFNRYIGNREIHSYYYFLKMCIKICHSISVKQPGYDTKMENLCISEAMKQLIIANIKRYDFPFLHDINSETVYLELEKAYNDRKWELPEEKEPERNENSGNIR